VDDLVDLVTEPTGDARIVETYLMATPGCARHQTLRRELSRAQVIDAGAWWRHRACH
jgi:hypothetical protein